MVAAISSGIDEAALGGRRLVLVGGGHAHLGVLRYLARHQPPGVVTTLVTKDVLVPYSGMVPGMIAGHYTADDCHIDLAPLAKQANVRLIHGKVGMIDRSARQVLLEPDCRIPYDILSLDIGLVAATRQVGGAEAHVLPVRPLPKFVDAWAPTIAAAAGGRAPGDLALVGGGAAGVELALAIASWHQQRGHHYSGTVTLICGRGGLLPGMAARFVRVVREALAGLGVVLVEGGHRIDAVTADRRLLTSGQALGPYDRVLWVTGGRGDDWLASTGLALSNTGLVRVNAALRAIDDPYVFAAGDIAEVEGHSRPRAGVFAVRQGLPLARNLLRALAGHPLCPFIPQRNNLVILALGHKRAVAVRNGITVSGAWVWRWKDRLDRRWIAQHRPPVS